MVVEPFGLPQNSFLDEAQPAGDSRASAVARPAADLNAMQSVFPESFGHNGPARPRHDAAPLISFVQPVADAAASVPLVDDVQSNRDAKITLESDVGRQAHARGIVDLTLL